MSPERFTELVRAEQESLRRFLLALCGGDSAEADDIAQDALIRAYVASGSFLGRSRFSTWLFRIAYNCYVDRRRRRRPEHLPTDIPQVLHLTASEETDQAFRHQRLHQALEALPEKEKAVIVLHYFEDRGVKEIAGILQMAPGTVKYYLFMGRNRLKTMLQ